MALVGAWVEERFRRIAGRGRRAPLAPTVLVDGPAVLGWERWRQVGQRYGLGLASAALQRAIDAGAVAAQPVAPLAHVLVGALDEAALYVSRAEQPERARAEVGQVLRRLVYSLGR